MRTWIKGGILVAAIYLLVQFIDDFFHVFLNIAPLEKVRYLLYFDFLNLHDSLVLRCYGWFELCGILYILVIGFIIGAIIGGIVGMFSKEARRREILKQHQVIQDGRFREAVMGKYKEKEEKLTEKENEEKVEEEEAPEIEIIPLKADSKKENETVKSKSKEKEAAKSNKKKETVKSNKKKRRKNKIQ